MASVYVDQCIDVVLQGLEKYLMTKLHGRTYSVCKEDQEIDRELAIRLAALQFVQPEHLDIPIRYYNEDTWMVRHIIRGCIPWSELCDDSVTLNIRQVRRG
eukprot:9386965-Pyramimonas_sp.AAC.1